MKMGESPRAPSNKFSLKKIFPPLTKNSFLQHYLPMSGALCHSFYMVHLYSPQIINRKFPVSHLAVANALFFNSHLGIGFYLYSRKHLMKLDLTRRVAFSVFTSTTFNFGTVLFAIILKGLFFQRWSSSFWRSVVASILSLGFLTTGYFYTNTIDRQCRL